jgi:hypothetical protein
MIIYQERDSLSRFENRELQFAHGLARKNNRAGAHPLPGFGIFPVVPKPGKGERVPVCHGDRERQLWFNRFPPFVESIHGNQAAAFGERPRKEGANARCGL